MHVKGRFIKCRYISEKGFTIAEYSTENESGVPITFVARGDNLPTDPHLDIILFGDIVDDPRYGNTFEVTEVKTSVIRTRDNVIGYLSSGVIKGVKKATAEKIVDYFGIAAADIIADDPMRLTEVSGIGEKVLEGIMESYRENEAIHGLMQYLGQYKVTINQAKKIVSKFGDRSLEIVRNDIYYLCEVHGFGFKTVDTIAKHMGHDLSTFPRVMAASLYVLKENTNNGHLFMTPDLYLKELGKLLNHKKSGFKFPIDTLRRFANETLTSDDIAYKNGNIYLSDDFEDESNSAVILAERLLSSHHYQTHIKVPNKITSDEVELSKEQEAAIKLALYHNTFIITGGPGTGKTAVLGAVLKYYRKVYGTKKIITLCAPTGRAAKRMAMATGFTAGTIHRQFHLIPDIDDFVPCSDGDTGYIDSDLVVIDEASMMDMSIFCQILKRLKVSTKLIIVGDKDQLPSVRAGNVLRELLKLPIIPSIHLSHVFRQESGTCIALNASEIKKGNTDLTYDNSFMFVQADNEYEAQEIITSMYLKASELVGEENVQVLSPMKKNGECGTRHLNKVLQRLYHYKKKTVMIQSTHQFQVGDIVIQNKNMNGISNGDMGKVTKVAHNSVEVSFFEYKTEIVKTFRHDTLKLIELAFALTVHKSQGSEYPIVIMPVLSNQKFMLKRNLLYTGITRGSARVVLVGQKETIQYAISHEDTERRRTLLAFRIEKYYNSVKKEIACDTKENLKQSA